VHAAGGGFPMPCNRGALPVQKGGGGGARAALQTGADVAGVVTQRADGAHRWTGLIALRLLTMRCGAMAEVVRLNPIECFKLPDTVSFEGRSEDCCSTDLTVEVTPRTAPPGPAATGETVCARAAGGVARPRSAVGAAWGEARTSRGGEHRGNKIAVAKAEGVDVVWPKDQGRR